jgi:hypothetical protein
VSNNRLDLGLDELREALRNLPDELTGEGSHIVEGNANGAAAQIKAGYKRRTGNLGDGVKVEPLGVGRFAAGVVVRNTAKHAVIFENGTQARHYYTINGVKHETGRMPPGHVFVPAVIRKRRQMYEQLKDLLVRNGLQVSGDAE